MPIKKNQKKPVSRRIAAAPRNKKTVKKTAAVPAFVRVPATRAMPAPKSRYAMYVYLGIILFFVSAAFYIYGRSYSILKPKAGNNANNVEIVDVAMINMSGMSAAQRVVLAGEYFVSGREKLLAGNITGAVLDLTISIEANPTDAVTHIYRGEAYLQVGDIAMAMADFNRSIELDDGNPVAWYDRALTHIRNEDFQAAISDLDTALERNAMRRSDVLSDRDIHARRGQLHLWTRNFTAAANDYTAAIVASVSDPFADDFAGRAEAYTNLGAFAPAISDYLSAITIISEKIQVAPTTEEREIMSRNAMSYFERSAALNVVTSDFIAARTDLESALTIALALQDADAVSRLRNLLTNEETWQQ